MLATCGPEGLDCSPRGDPPGFVRVVDEHTLLIPDRRGNNRIDRLRNLVRDPRVALLFLIPGVGETMRVNGRARISTDPKLTESFAMNGKVPKCVLVVTVERAYFQCTKAIIRSKLWDPASKVDRKTLPTPGSILAEMTDGKMGGPEHDRLAPERIKADDLLISHSGSPRRESGRHAPHRLVLSVFHPHCHQPLAHMLAAPAR